MIGTPASTAIRAAPALRSFTVKLVLIVASGKTPTTSPSFRARTADSNAAAPAFRSTGMCRMARMNGPANQWSKTGGLGHEPHQPVLRQRAQPQEGEVEEADVVAADDGAAGGRHVLGAAHVEAEAEQPEDDQRHPDDEAVGPVAPVGAAAEEVAADDVAPARGVHGRTLAARAGRR